MIYLFVAAVGIAGFFIGVIVGALLTDTVGNTDLSGPRDDYD
ncbi:hypothetical protein [Epilithonimonas mollis]|uniref:Uncharacterized protein n=1 Tax=Epilithonimonas mollis TaxID=216903 RepID=A0A1M6UJ85_9FLAO|nr:hypothetical protein [Epilithonimonas mollis]SHK69295.1 hypothetical protein SAMN05444371_3325 [Epilithonimonas mollis]